MDKRTTRGLSITLRPGIGFARLVLLALVLLALAAIGPGAVAQEGGGFVTPGTYDNVRQPEPQLAQQRPVRRAAPAPAEVETPAPAAELAVSARVVVFGDSLAHNLGSGLRNVLEDAPEISLATEARGSSGLVRDDFHDWPAAVEELLSGDDPPDIGVVMVGLNDRQILTVAGETLQPLSDPWRAAYAERVDEIINAFASRELPLIWVGLPPMSSPRLSTDLAVINEIVRERARQGGAFYVDIWKGFVDEDNRYSASGPNLSGQNARLRASDGIHFTPAGASKAAHFADIEIRRLIARPTDRIAIARAAVEAAEDPSARDEAIDLLIQRSLGELPALPGFEHTPPRVEIGPLLPLTRLDIAPGGALLSGRPSVDPATRIITERALEEGIAPTPVPGRADDFSWPRQPQ
jgi:uncharacterized protein